jgi:uncharacterized protein DUF6882
MKLITIGFLVLLVLIPCLAQDQTTVPCDFATLQKLSIEELQLKTEAHKAWGLDKILRWDFKQSSGELELLLPEGMKAVSPAQIIGTYNSEDHTWLWAWANPSVEEKLQADARQLLKYGEEHHIDRLTKRKWVGTEEDAWAMAALAVKLCGKQGAYRGPSGATKVFMVFGEVTLTKK